MSERFVLAITGPSGSGKSTVGEKVAKQLDHCVNIDADHIKHMVVSGFYVDKNNPENPSGWGFSEWELVGESIGLLAHNFLDHDYDVIINGYIDEPAWMSLQRHVTLTRKVLLLPHLDTVIQRDAGRNEDVRMGDAAVKKHHIHFSSDSFFDDFVKLDSTDHTTEETVSKIVEIVKQTKA